ncbi:MAG: radical SAM protein [Candidatus Jettenia sp.]|uniref:7-carboxy-7-deazaguanine synthase n=1 Tax=Candidatus Jettenia caeni TaxID=247490 RepID=I3INJ2_9BACT|nr:radical SAM protein [Candidatus Jettenia sp. AMX1]MBC6927891.1 radical SAM protein [Candidatus Jettenia sp.]NUN21883.1 radical SAM protein [Candidatus Jettenia caeni]KAA0248214.1 MAG: radical SAM protein [Candidatus Jettenia sp. AMX1]MCE7879494.1 radical SAM protein [Candidatus Jettenia sp. AMX1]MDL1937881.1 radical SAM protein [Candidatus Jettenia sp. AMX1]
MKINEIFKSIQGETSYAGLPCTFIRITGCNLRCRYCDTTYAYEDGVEMSMNSILESIHDFSSNLVCITGGEPLSNEDTPLLIQRLLDKNYTVLVETNGSYDIRTIPEKAVTIMDIKCPGSTMSHTMHWQNIAYLRQSDEVKFVLASRDDYKWTKDVIQKYNLSEIAKVLLGTVFNTIAPRSVVQWILEDNLKVRFQLQLHKYIWEPHTRGV